MNKGEQKQNGLRALRPQTVGAGDAPAAKGQSMKRILGWMISVTALGLSSGCGAVEKVSLGGSDSGDEVPTADATGPDAAPTVDTGLALDSGPPPPDGAPTFDSGLPPDVGPPLDSGFPPDGGPAFDSGLPPDAFPFDDGVPPDPPDGGPSFDAGFPPDIGSSVDGGVPPDPPPPFDAALPPDVGAPFDGDVPWADAGAWTDGAPPDPWDVGVWFSLPTR